MDVDKARRRIDRARLAEADEEALTRYRSQRRREIKEQLRRNLSWHVLSGGLAGMIFAGVAVSKMGASVEVESFTATLGALFGGLVVYACYEVRRRRLRGDLAKLDKDLERRVEAR